MSPTEIAAMVARNIQQWERDLKTAGNGPATTEDVRAILSLLGDLAEAVRMHTAAR